MIALSMALSFGAPALNSPGAATWKEPHMATTTGPHRFADRGVRRTVTPRSRGALTGFGLVLLGAWGALIPFVGPYFDYAYTPNHTWTWTAARFWLQVLPGGVAFFAGLLLLFTAHRVVAYLSAWIAIAAGAWFVVGPLLAPIWRANYLGTPVGDRTDVAVENIGMFYGLGAAIILLAAMAAGRFSVVGVRDMELASAAAERTIVMPDAAPVESRTSAEHAGPVAAAAPVGTTAAMDSEAPVGTPAPAYQAQAPVADETAADQPVAGEVQDSEMTEQPHRHRRFVGR
jgi:hypothetical protein